jgi:hypothetical protein
MPFATLPSTVWVLGDSIAQSRRHSLLAPPSFEDIVRTLREAAVIHWRGRKPPNRPTEPPTKRFVVILAFPNHEWAVDLFHNSAAGVRAQCLRDVTIGGEALDHARNVLRDRAVELLEFQRLTPPFREFALKSLGEESTKIWIHQGKWCRHAKVDVRELRIREWEESKPSCKRGKQLVRYGSKAPTDPPLIDVLGGLFTARGDPFAGKPSDSRPRNVNRFGFT